MNKHTRSVSLIDGHTEGMTDAEIIKVLECCSVENCEDCKKDWSYVSQWDCMRHIMRLSLDLINRQQAEIEMLTEERDFYKAPSSLLAKGIEQIKSEAIKEFAERLKEEDGYNNHIFDDCASILVSKEYVKGRDEKIKEIWNTIDNLVKEMTEEGVIQNDKR